jgi:hypothetical protein
MLGTFDQHRTGNTRRRCGRLALLHALPRLSAALVHADPEPRHGTDHHATLASHR